MRLLAALAAVAAALHVAAQEAQAGEAALQVDLPQLSEASQLPRSFELDDPVTVSNASGQRQLLMGMDDGQLMLSFPNMPGAVAIVPVTDRGLNLTREFPSNYDRFVVNADSGDFEPLYRRLIPVADPLLPFLVLPESKCNFHPMAYQYYRAAAVVAPLDKLLELSSRIPWGQVSEDFVGQLERVVRRSIEEGNIEVTERLLAIALRSLSDQRFAEIAFPTADRLRSLGYAGLASKIYGSMSRSTDPVLSQRSVLWAGYSSAVSGNPQDARAILEQLPDFDRKDENFIIFCLARGRLGIAEENYVDGLRYLTRAMVMSDYTETYKPELYFLLLESYRQLGNSEVVDRLSREFEIFYPDNPWFVKYRELEAEG